MPLRGTIHCQTHSYATARYDSLPNTHSYATARYDSLPNTHSYATARYDSLPNTHSYATARYDSLPNTHSYATARYDSLPNTLLRKDGHQINTRSKTGFILFEVVVFLHFKTTYNQLSTYSVQLHYRIFACIFRIIMIHCFVTWWNYSFISCILLHLHWATSQTYEIN